ncbi:MAG: hypothetical protein JST28_21155 [Acidobacteria bacterium]|nr:hypothetical protein [Acidobacteriota bacterium]
MRLRILQNAGMLLMAAFASTDCIAQNDWLSLCGQCLSPSVYKKSGIGTANAVAEAKVTLKDAQMWCGSWQPDDKDCARQQLATPEAKSVYRVSANCIAGTITAADEQKYTLAGVWTSDVGKGRVRFRDAKGAAVGQDEASGGLAVAGQWELLCPGVKKATGSPAAAGSSNASPSAVSQFASGDHVEAKYVGAWVHGTIRRVIPAGQAGTQTSYDVVLDNGRRGILPASMIRSVQHPTGSAGTEPESEVESTSKPVMSSMTSPEPDPCGSKQYCYNGQLFTAQVNQLILAQEPRYRTIRMNVVFRNLSNAPIILGYAAKSSTIIDNEGTAFYPVSGNAGDISAVGMGVVSAGKADTSFVLEPGQSRNVTFQLYRRQDKSIFGTSFSWNAKIVQLRVLSNGQQVTTAREFSVNIPDVARLAEI